eukprot:GHRQ01018465.1.p1 GENE.GHRQ01018465.1~~GHRQ01018465.1.p1  ORF type:complete len:116 (-),score=20.06 GHRQ01018465.1:351-698(-)
MCTCQVGHEAASHISAGCSSLRLGVTASCSCRPASHACAVAKHRAQHAAVACSPAKLAVVVCVHRLGRLRSGQLAAACLQHYAFKLHVFHCHSAVWRMRLGVLSTHACVWCCSTA